MPKKPNMDSGSQLTPEQRMAREETKKFIELRVKTFVEHMLDTKINFMDRQELTKYYSAQSQKDKEKYNTVRTRIIENTFHSHEFKDILKNCRQEAGGAIHGSFDMEENNRNLITKVVDECIRERYSKD